MNLNSLFLYFYTLVCYIAISFFQLFLLKYLPLKTTEQLIVIFFGRCDLSRLNHFCRRRAKFTTQPAVRDYYFLLSHSAQCLTIFSGHAVCGHYGGVSALYW